MPPEATGAAAPQAGAAAQPQAGTTTSGQEPPAAPGQEPAAAGSSGTGSETGNAAGSGGETAESKAARLERENADLRKEQAANRTKLNKIEADQRAAATAGLSDLEKAQAAEKEARDRAATLEQQLADTRVRSATFEAAARLGFRNPEVAYRLLDRSDLELDAEGQPKNVEKLLKELLQREPYLGKGAGGDFGGGNRGGTPDTAPGMNELLRAAFKG